MTIQQARRVNQLINSGDWQGAATAVNNLLGKPAAQMSKGQATELFRGLFQYLVDNDKYLEAATLQWGPDMFLTEPESIQRSFEAVQGHSMLMVMGASSLGKSYGVGAWMVLDYLRDPLYTSVKLAAVSEKHLRENLYPHLAKLIRNCAIPCRYEIEFKESDMWMGVKRAGYEFGISGIAFKQSQETSGQFKGYKSMPVRKTPHPKFGIYSRLRVLCDEAQNFPGGPFQDFNSLIASINGIDRVKLVCAFNPENLTCRVVQMSEPEHGWDPDDLERLYDWNSKHGWRVCRLDAAKCENVIQRKIVYEGLQSYEGYLKYLKSGGDNSAAYYCFARGFPPLVGTVNNIIPPQWPQQIRGEATFIETPKVLASIDLAFMGKDSAQMAIARWGKANSWRDHTGRRENFKDRLNIGRDKPRHVLQIDQIMPLTKHDDTTRMAEEIMAKCKMMKIAPEWVVIDKTGIGLGTYSHLKRVWGDVLGISWNEKATEGKIMSEDNEGADKQCEGVMSEMWWTFRRWMDPQTGAIIINPIIPTQPIHTQLTSRRFKTGKRGIKVEPKDEYRARNAQASPDEADALVMLPHLVRLRGDVLPGLVEEHAPSEDDPTHSRVEYQTVKEFANTDQDDSISEDGSEKDLNE